MPLLALPEASGQQHAHPAGSPRQATLMSGLGAVHHAVSTKNPEAQRFFDQGLALIYGFNHEEAVLSFQRAADLDPECAMAYWGIALAVGPNYNDAEPDLNREKTAWDAINKARSLAAHATEPERAYIEALEKRYSDEPKPDLQKLAVNYKNAMSELAKRYPDDLDAATLFAESAMDLHPWQLWSADGKPADGTEEIVATLQSVLKRDPRHTGANHFYIHAVEASPNPGQALESANRLAQLAPAAGHLVHMPAHIYIRTGNYDGAMRSNEKAAEVDRDYIQRFNVTGMYPAMYYNHNIHFLAIAAGIEGRYEDATRAAAQLIKNASPLVKEIPMMASFLPTQELLLVRFGRWDEILRLPEPDKAELSTHALWHFSRGMSYVGTHKLDDAEAERDALLKAAGEVPAETMLGFNHAKDLLSVAGHLLEGRIALARVNTQAAVEHFRQAAEIEDKLLYDEPPDWFIPSREALGHALMVTGNYREAEKVFREDLARHPASGRSLFGLWQCLKADGNKTEAKRAEADFREAWKHADVKLSLDDL
jgi:tetratricopeptide (TPR) repeat protein